ncbi:bifunctional 3-(3-hydroxy-phenyl)propionate/3-hydroxycinnamic acid hydroxylase [Acidiferrimicrobium sp. IK]|uniref:bifunctional 3-(3-hydroxy-phenyl)propionate/3-hydroxycinnamic acid hydroxylase MhpA n=1 Tax=Acidiferrimicrobium sp. IK TaxID=2871700 RepID=UPI0021CB02E6|nr:bifunctional 3-(3-hydroxy-phenyl)propionate/3-hydroxycinnamic acid hydroxylase [Acidiferrimicrobium sp. IK]MCU4183193.1 bifunctional 3-(3-hydroxy-phenyl)propionate/3-hydroxycinnamic acid hydroxylase [Acidiferrimicrobium sp. IK]
MTGPDPEVTVVGAGPVGMTLAALLGGRGRRVVVLDKQPRPVAQPRAVHLDHQGARILDAAGVMEALAPDTEVMDAYEWRNPAGQVLLRLQPDGPLGRSGWPESLMFSQPALEALLAERLAALPSVEVRRGRQVSDLAELGGGWVVGCDGANSTVRSLLGIASADAGYSFDWLVVDVVEDQPRHWIPCNVQVCDPARPTTAVSGGPGRRRFEFMRLPGEDPDELASEATAWRLLAAWQLDAGSARLERHALYRFDARVAEEWRKGRFLLAGDAAHQMPPFAGQGLCAGLRDASNLAWKLDMVLAGAPAALLDTYASERRPQTRTEIDFSVELGRVICVSDPDAAAARDRDMVAAAKRSGPIAPPPLPALGPGLLRAGDPAAGTLSVQGQITAGGRHGHLDAVIGRGWVLYGRDGDPGRLLGADAAAWFADLGGRSLDCSDAPAPYPEWFRELGAAVILVRPDFAVYGAARHTMGAGDLVTGLRRQLAAMA